ncbi:MAG: SIS domain-containing protein [Deltaproteobacteria bacterium]|nr:SIS domain-containing protein [Deltaproteobacteria bacterium]
MIKLVLRRIAYELKKPLRALLEWNYFIGRDPENLPCRSIIFFPVIADSLFCGLAGILAIKKKTEIKKDFFEDLCRLWEKIQSNGFEKLLDGSIAVEGYLGGLRVLGSLEDHILYLKKDETVGHTIFQEKGSKELHVLLSEMNAFLAKEEKSIEKDADRFTSASLEEINRHILLFKDSVWALQKDIIENIEQVCSLAGEAESRNISRDIFSKYWKLNSLLNSIDRLEVRGRDSAGIQVITVLKDRKTLDRVISGLKKGGLQDEFEDRTGPGDLRNNSIHVCGDVRKNYGLTVGFTYKKASVTGRLGENCRYLRDIIASDRIFKSFINEKSEMSVCFGHTRWASVGAINEENCHPVNNFTLNSTVGIISGIPSEIKDYPYYGKGAWSITAALNGDIDNYKVLRSRLESDGPDLIDFKINTDTKIIPIQIEKYLYAGHDLKEAFRLALNDFEGSQAIALHSNLEPGKIFLSLRGSGQSLYVGLCGNQYIFASEVYGLIEMTPFFIKIDGEKERVEGDEKTRGQIFVLSQESKDMFKGIDAVYYDGQPLDINKSIVQRAEISTRDIDRKEFPHFLLKEISEAPLSIIKTLRGKYRIEHQKGGKSTVVFNIGEDIFPLKLKDAFLKDKIKKIFVIGQGTAAVAANAIAAAISDSLKGLSIFVNAIKASEFSGFFLERDLSDTLVIAVTQSGTTTDTNRAVAMARERKAHLIAIVNRRQSDITQKADGVFYTSDGRDIEMSVASTKAFYSQIVAGNILGLYFAQVMGVNSDDTIARKLTLLMKAPEMMNRVISKKEQIKESAWELAKRKRYWAVVGSGPNKIAADEIRIKLSELCYKTISSDIVEDKKHIDLSAEPLIFVCAAGNPEPVTDDIVKDVSIFKAHAGSVVVIAEEKEKRFNYIADYVIPVPESAFPVSIILNTVVGHLWGYYAACSIDEEAAFFRSFRSKLSVRRAELNRKLFPVFEIVADTSLHKIIELFSSEYSSRKNKGFLSSMSVETASDITLLLKYATGKLPLEDFWQDFEEKRTSPSPLDMLDICLGRAIDELSRSIDAIRHQAKTVTVGTSRKEIALKGIVFEMLKDLDFSIENMTSRVGIAAGRIQAAISAINGFTLYKIDNLDFEGKPGNESLISVEKRSGISLRMKTRIKRKVPLTGTKKIISGTGDIFAGLGKSDRAPIVIIPLLGKEHIIRHILLLHVTFNETLEIPEKREILADKYDSLCDLVNEYNLRWEDSYLEGLNIDFLLGESVDVIASKIMEQFN